MAEQQKRRSNGLILSVSRRTDIPAFYAEWFFQRLKEGFLCVRNPMNVYQVSRISLSPSVVDCIVFWTKDPAPMLPHLEKLKGYDYYFQYTVNAYGNDAEPRVPPLDARIRTFRELSERIGRERVIWRYDPIFFSETYTVDRHLSKISEIARALKGFTEKCVFSFVDIYPTKNLKNMKHLHQAEIHDGAMSYFLEELVKIAKENELVLATCAEAVDLEKYGIIHNSCIDKALIERITGSRLKVGADGQRSNCQCVKCDDIGAYDTCPHGCVYCYANFRSELVERKIQYYDVNSPLLCDNIDPLLDKINDRPVRSFKLPPEPTADTDDFEQLSLF